ncbi:MAG: flavodoxin family protein [Candidatus Marinimicrobia bacterium]|nr:flavodoxin family protein [Candidatus Neomarinimicrobiota bacterium]
MRAMVIYDSVFGNTEKVAKIIGETLGTSDEVTVLRVTNVNPKQLTDLDLLIVGSPTRAFKATPAINAFLAKIPSGALNDIHVAAFDTRMSIKDVKSSILTFFAKIFGFAAEPIAAKLRKKQGLQIVPPEGFIVIGSEGPLREGEQERATRWADQIKKLYDNSH